MDERQIPLKAWPLGLLEPTAYFLGGNVAYQLSGIPSEFAVASQGFPGFLSMSPVFRCGGRVVS